MEMHNVLYLHAVSSQRSVYLYLAVFAALLYMLTALYASALVVSVTLQAVLGLTLVQRRVLSGRGHAPLRPGIQHGAHSLLQLNARPPLAMSQDSRTQLKQNLFLFAEQK